MPYQWPADTEFASLELDVLDRDCPACGRMMAICDHRYRRFHTLDGPLELVCKLNHCPDPNYPGHARTKSPELEITLALPRWAIAWDVFCWIGQRRFSRHWSITQIQAELLDACAIKLSADPITDHTQPYQVMLAARQQDPDSLPRHHESGDEIILTIDGLQPEKGPETLHIVRELTQKRVWFAEPLISATDAEVQRLIAQAKQLADSLGKTVELWVSDKQDAFVKGLAAEFPDVPHRYGENHFLRDVARPVLEADSHAKVQMRKEVRGLRQIGRAVLEGKRASTDPAPTPEDPQAPLTVSSESVNPKATEVDSAGEVVLAYCTAVRGLLDDDQGGPLEPPGLRMADALREVRESIQRNLEAKRGVRRAATWPPGRLHRPGLEGSSRRARDDPRVCQGSEGDRCDP